MSTLDEWIIGGGIVFVSLTFLVGTIIGLLMTREKD